MYIFITTTRTSIWIPKRISSNFNKLVLKTKSSLAKLTTYNKFILLVFFITNKFEKMKYSISRVILRTFENPISIILHVYNIGIQNVSFHVIFTIVSFMDV